MIATAPPPAIAHHAVGHVRMAKYSRENPAREKAPPTMSPLA